MSDEQVSRVLAAEFGIEGGIRYAERIASSNGPLATEYAEAADQLRAKRRSLCDECGIYPATVLRRNEHICEGCDSYREHTAV